MTRERLEQGLLGTPPNLKPRVSANLIDGPVPKGFPYTSRVVWVMQVRRRLPRGYWCVFIEGADILIGAEHIFGPANLEMKQYDLLDGSIGARWAAFCRRRS